MPELSTLGATIKAAYEGEADTNAYTDVEKTKLAGLTIDRHTIRNEGVALPPRFSLNFIGSDVTAADDSGNNRTNVTIGGPTTQVLTSGTSVTWNTGLGYLATLVLGHNATLSMTNLANSTELRLVVQQDGIGGRSFDLDGISCTWLVGDQGVASAASAVSIYDLTVVGALAYVNRRGAGLV